MKRKIKVGMLILVIAGMCCGCGVLYASTTRDIRHSGFSLSGAEFECPELFPSSNGYTTIEFLTSTHAITNDGNVYSLSLSQVYSNEKNCMASTLSTTVVSIFDSKVVKGRDGKLYYLTAVDKSPAYSVVPTSDSDYYLYKLILGDENVVKVVSVDQSSGIYYVLKNDGNVYNYVVSKNGNNVSLTSTSIVYNKNDYGGSIVDFNYAGKSSTTFIRTNTQIYRMIAQNKEQCTKYVDIECEYRMELDEGLSKHMDKILGYSGSLLITTYGKEFNATS